MAANQTGDQRGITRRTALASVAGIGAVGLAGCTQSGDESSDGLSGEISIAGSSTVFPLMSAIGEEFEVENPGVNIDISSTGSGGGFSNFFCEGRTDFNNASRPIQPAEEELCAGNDVEYIELIAATDALTVVVNNDNYVTPSLETASSGEYTPLSRNLYTYPSMSSLAEEHIAEFARYFVEQTTNEEIVANDVGYVPATEETQEAQLSKLEDAITEAQG